MTQQACGPRTGQHGNTWTHSNMHTFLLPAQAVTLPQPLSPASLCTSCFKCANAHVHTVNRGTASSHQGSCTMGFAAVKTADHPQPELPLHHSSPWQVMDKPLHTQAPARFRLSQLFHHGVLHPTPTAVGVSPHQEPCSNMMDS